MKTLRPALGAFCTCFALAFAACAADRDSGGDAERHVAKPLASGKWDPDTLDRGSGDTTDWKVMDLQDTGFLTVELVLDDPSAGVVLSVFDRFGKPLARATHRDGDGPQLKLTTEVGIGKVFLRVLHEAGAKSGYTIRAAVR